MTASRLVNKLNFSETIKASRVQVGSGVVAGS